LFTATSLFGSPATNLQFTPVHFVKSGTYKISQIAELDKAVLLLRTPSGYQLLPVPNKYVAVLGDYIFVRLDMLAPGSRLLIPLNQEAFSDSDLAQINVYYPYNIMDPQGRNGDYSTLFFMGVETSYWIDYNYDGLLLPSETARIQYDIREGNAFHVQIGEPEEAFQLAKQVALDYLEKYYGINASDAPSMPVLDIRIFSNAYYGTSTPKILPLKTVMTKYKEEVWSWVTVTGSNGLYQVNVTVPENTKPGVYEGYLKVTDGTYTTYMPISVSVPFIVEPGKPSLVAGHGANTLYENYVFHGALDQGWRPEVGDWRVYPVLLDNIQGNIVALKVRVMWSDSASSFDLALNGPGFNFWGVGSSDYVAWVDAATVGAKISGVSRYVGVNGVYTYFDWPTQRASEILAPVTTPLFDSDSSVYWLVVHQVFQGRDPDRVVIMITPLTVTDNTIAMKAGTTKAKLTSFYSANMGAAQLAGSTTVIPLTGGLPTDIEVTVISQQLPATPQKNLMIVVHARQNTSGYYLVMIPYITSSPSVIWGFNAQGMEGTLYSQPTLFFVNFLVAVKP
jgi:hypothetical protein